MGFNGDLHSGKSTQTLRITNLQWKLIVSPLSGRVYDNLPEGRFWIPQDPLTVVIILKVPCFLDKQITILIGQVHSYC